MSSDNNISSMDLGNISPDRIRLRPLASVTRKEVIQKNLVTLEQNLSKKKRAQAHYYSRLKGRSPLVVDGDMKPPVHARLGSSMPHKRRVPFIGTSTNTLLPRNKSYTNTNRKKGLSVQNRLYKIRKELPGFSLKTSKRLLNIPSLKVQVVNDTAPSMISTRFKLVLNPAFQEEIRHIQAMNQREIFHGIHPVTPVSTHKTLNERFTYLS